MQKHVSRAARNGFTLIELIIVVVVIASLSAIAVAGYSAVTEKAEDRAAESTLQAVDREFRANDAFNKMGDRGSVAIADMTEAAELGVTFNDEDGNGRLDTDETVTVETSEKVWTLTLKDATTEGGIGSELIPTTPSAAATTFSRDGEFINVVPAPQNPAVEVEFKVGTSYNSVLTQRSYYPHFYFPGQAGWVAAFGMEINKVQFACRVVHNGQRSPSGEFKVLEFDVGRFSSGVTFWQADGNRAWGEGVTEKWGEGSQNCYSTVEIDGEPASYWAELERLDTINFEAKMRIQDAEGWSDWSEVFQAVTPDCEVDAWVDRSWAGNCKHEWMDDQGWVAPYWSDNG